MAKTKAKAKAKKAPAKKTAAKKKAAAKKTAPKKTAAKKTAAKKTVAKKAPARKISAKKPPAKKPPAKVPPAEKPYVTEGDVEQVTVNSTCKTVPQSTPLGGPNHKHKVQFHCGAGQIFYLKLKGGVFIGQPVDFALAVDGPAFVPDPPLEVVSGVNDRIINYVFDSDNKNCPHQDQDDPPEIVIQS